MELGSPSQPGGLRHRRRQLRRRRRDQVYNTDPKKADTDDDGLDDAEELFLITDPPIKSDGDGYTDGAEIYGTAPARSTRKPSVRHAG